jgi:phosphatidylinositol phospholipase C, beta
LKKEIKPSDTASSSPKHRQSNVVTTTNQLNTEPSVESSSDNNVASGSNLTAVPLPTVESTTINKAATLPRNLPEITSNEADEIVAETLEKIFEHKSIREKREQLEKKIRALKKTHDKRKVEVSQSEIGDGKKSSIFSSNRLVKRLSSKNM